MNKVLIANRGEIALRIVRACKDLGVASVAVYSDADKDSLHVNMAGEAVHIGPPIARKSYLNMERILAAAKYTGADAIHPGYGFLAESADFAEACKEAGLIFIGPPGTAIALSGNKSRARKILMDIGIPVIPGSEDVIGNAEEAVTAAEKVGFPVILKASGGGGGRGMRIANDPAELVEAFATASGEALASFGNPDIYVEKYIERPRHIEVQILADSHGNVVHLGERECSIQKRYQKLIEESPSPFVDEDLRHKLGETAVAAAKAVGYENAGTVEFLVDADKNFHFMEINARVQVEHPVTEMVTGIDIIAEQLSIAAGEPLSVSQKDVVLRGCAMECRINAADPDNDFAPSPGEVESVVLPAGPWVRIDTYLAPGCLVPPFYDSLVAKLVIWAPDRSIAIARMQRALSELTIQGIEVTTSFHRKVLAHEDFIGGDFDTHFLEQFSAT